MRSQETQPIRTETGSEKSISFALAAAIQRAVVDFQGQLDLAQQLGVAKVPRAKRESYIVKRPAAPEDLIAASKSQSPR